MTDSKEWARLGVGTQEWARLFPGVDKQMQTRIANALLREYGEASEEKLRNLKMEDVECVKNLGDKACMIINAHRKGVQVHPELYDWI